MRGTCKGVCPPTARAHDPRSRPPTTPDLARRTAPHDTQTSPPDPTTDHTEPCDGPNEPPTETTHERAPHARSLRTSTAARPDWPTSCDRRQTRSGASTWGDRVKRGVLVGRRTGQGFAASFDQGACGPSGALVVGSARGHGAVAGLGLHAEQVSQILGGRFAGAAEERDCGGVVLATGMLPQPLAADDVRSGDAGVDAERHVRVGDIV